MLITGVFMLFPLLWALLTAFRPKNPINTYPPVFFTIDLTLGNFSYAINSNNIPLEKAACIDGCNRIQVLYRVVLSILTPGLLAVALINFITVWNDFVIPLIFTPTTDMKTITLGLYGILSLSSVHKGIVNAAAIISLPPVVLLFLIFRKRFNGSVLEGAVKG